MAAYQREDNNQPHLPADSRDTNSEHDDVKFDAQQMVASPISAEKVVMIDVDIGNGVRELLEISESTDITVRRGG